MYYDYIEIKDIFLEICCNDEKVIYTKYCSEKKSDIKSNFLTEMVKEQINKYLNHEINQIILPLDFTDATPFSYKIYMYLLTNNRQKITYSELAHNIGHSNSQRAVGTAMKKNKYPIIVPCHLVVNSKGIGKFTNASTDIKAYLIDKTVK